MAEINCCSGSTCQELVTIGYMRELAVSACTTVSAASSFSSCCEADESAYTPTYGEISGGTYAPVRVISGDPKDDINGFSASSANVAAFTSCCSQGPISASQQNLMRSDLAYGYTHISGITFSKNVSSSPCDTSWTVNRRRYYNRYLKTCGNVVVESVVTGDEQVSAGTFSRTYSQFNSDGSSGSVQVSYNPVTVSSDTTDRCGNYKSGDTEVSKAGYTITVSMTCPTSEIPCNGTTIPLYFGGTCSNDTVSITSATVGTSETVQSTYNETGGTITIGTNNFSQISGTLTVGIKVRNESQTPAIETSGTVECSFRRQTCGITPVTTNHIKCGAFPGDDDWCKKNGNMVVCYNCDGTPVNN